VELHAGLADLPNVTLQRPVADMRDVYKRTKILLAPSRWEEAYGRVASEVQISGIPVVASDRGGLPEAVGAGGILLNPDGDIADWVSAVEKLWSDKKYYDDMVAAALVHAARPALNVDDQLTMWEDLLHSQIKTEKQFSKEVIHGQL
jgi:glycosyltransferase involved in cell wall biosynthesis